jgi:hypothetical protein
METKDILISILNSAKNSLASLAQTTPKGQMKGEIQDFVWTLRVLIRSARAIELEKEESNANTKA